MSCHQPQKQKLARYSSIQDKPFHQGRILEEIRHKHPPTPIQTDNTTALGFVTKKSNPKTIKSTDMRYWWLRDILDQIFRYYLGQG